MKQEELYNIIKKCCESRFNNQQSIIDRKQIYLNIEKECFKTLTKRFKSGEKIDEKMFNTIFFKCWYN